MLLAIERIGTGSNVRAGVTCADGAASLSLMEISVAEKFWCSWQIRQSLHLDFVLNVLVAPESGFVSAMALFDWGVATPWR